jgi:hypothetical protein
VSAVFRKRRPIDLRVVLTIRMPSSVSNSRPNWSWVVLRKPPKRRERAKIVYMRKFMKQTLALVSDCNSSSESIRLLAIAAVIVPVRSIEAPVIPCV